MLISAWDSQNKHSWPINARGDPIRAAYVALQIAAAYALREKLSVASAWTRRAERLLDGRAETYAHGYLALMRSNVAKASGDIARALELAEEAVAIGERTGHPDLQAFALTAQATLRIATGTIGEGIGLLEEAAIAAVNGELSPLTAGVTACQMISACRDLTDYRRASEWIELTDRWCETQSVGGFPGVCRVDRAEIAVVQGDWQRAEEELRRATQELEKFEAIPPMADGLYAIGEIRRLRGDLGGAGEVLRQAHALGRSPQPALALIRLESGKVKLAAAAIKAALAESSWDAGARWRVLAAQVDITLKGGNTEQARMAVEQMAEIIDDASPPAMRAVLAYARGRVLLAEGNESASARELSTALRLWREVGSAYEIARTRAALSRALRASGDEDDADLELRAARDEFERLGAKPDLAAVEAELRELEERRASRVQVRMTFLFTDIVGSTKLAEALGDHAWNCRCAGTTRCSAPRLRGKAAGSSTPPGTVFLQRSTPHARRSEARSRSSAPSCRTRRPPDSRRRSGSGSTPPTPRSAAMTSVGSAYTWRPGSRRLRAAARSSLRRRPWARRAMLLRPASARSKSAAYPSGSELARSPGRTSRLLDSNSEPTDHGALTCSPVTQSN
jgi:tetratricopeptide (TPR) repeat protein